MNDFGTCNFLAHVAATLFMVGLIWFVQIVHYPLFQRVGSDGFGGYERDHQRLTTYVVAPVMLCELATAWLLLVWRPEPVPVQLVWLSLGGLIAIWGLTFAVQVPQHRRLAAGYDEQAARQLVSGNWWRTWAWTLRGGLVLWMMWLALK